MALRAEGLKGSRLVVSSPYVLNDMSREREANRTPKRTYSGSRENGDTSQQRVQSFPSSGRTSSAGPVKEGLITRNTSIPQPRSTSTDSKAARPRTGTPVRATGGVAPVVSPIVYSNARAVGQSNLHWARPPGKASTPRASSIGRGGVESLRKSHSPHRGEDGKPLPQATGTPGRVSSPRTYHSFPASRQEIGRVSSLPSARHDPSPSRSHGREGTAPSRDRSDVKPKAQPRSRSLLTPSSPSNYSVSSILKSPSAASASNGHITPTRVRSRSQPTPFVVFKYAGRPAERAKASGLRTSSSDANIHKMSNADDIRKAELLRRDSTSTANSKLTTAGKGRSSMVRSTPATPPILSSGPPGPAGGPRATSRPPTESPHKINNAKSHPPAAHQPATPKHYPPVSGWPRAAPAAVRHNGESDSDPSLHTPKGPLSQAFVYKESMERQGKEHRPYEIQVIPTDRVEMSPVLYPGHCAPPSTPEPFKESDNWVTGDPHHIQVGSILNNQYETVALLGEGSWSFVWLAWDFVQTRFVAMKVSLETPDKATHEIELYCLANKQSQGLEDEGGVVKMLDSFVFEAKGGKNYVMVFEVLGCTLLNLLHPGGKPTYKGVPLLRVRQIARSALAALHHVHHRMKAFHCDLKPENVLLSPADRHELEVLYQYIAPFLNRKGIARVSTPEDLLVYLGCDKKSSSTVKIIDFGSSRPIGDVEYSVDMIQTVEYRAPEIVLGFSDVGEKIDIWSMACIIWELITGHYLFEPGEDRKGNEKHVALFISRLGPVPVRMTHGGKYTNRFFDSEGRFLHPQCEFIGFSDLVNDYGLNPVEAEEVSGFLRPMLLYDPAHRVSAGTHVHHPWLSHS